MLSGVYNLPFKINFGGVATLASGLPYNYTTGTTNSGDTGATTDRPVINGVVVGRNTGRGNPIYDLSPFLERAFALGEKVHLTLRVEAFNVLNHVNAVGYSGIYGNGTSAPWLRRAAGGNHEPVAGAVCTIFGKGRVLTNIPL